MPKFKILILKHILKRREKHTEDKKLHETIDNADVDNNDFDFIVKEVSKPSPFDKKK